MAQITFTDSTGATSDPDIEKALLKHLDGQVGDIIVILFT